MAENIKSARALALDSLVKCGKYGKYPNLEVAASLKSSVLGDADRRLYTLLVYGVTERVITLDRAIESLSSKPLAAIDAVTLNALRLGIFQLAFTERIPEHAAVSETVDTVPKKSKSFVNAILRSFIRGGKRIELPPQGTTEYLSVKYSCPAELCDHISKCLGYSDTERLLASTFERHPVSLRVNTLVTDADTLIREVFPAGRKSGLFDDMITVDILGTLPEDGRWFVQDEASRAAAAALGACPGETVVDTCAAPGGKTFSIAIDMRNTGVIHSFDIRKSKISLIEKGAERLGLTNVTAECRDARDTDGSLVGKADRVICDAPCSGLGVIGKKPDIKYKSVEDVKRLPEIQYEVLSGAARYVKPGGVLVYSTCTVLADENEKVVERFLQNEQSFSLKKGAIFGCESAMKTFLPYEDHTDGFFVAVMTRGAENE